MSLQSKFRQVFLVAFGFVVFLSCTAYADTFPFVLAINDGLKLEHRGTDANGLSVFVSEGQISPLVNGTISPDDWGTARVIAWYRSVTDPFFSPLQPIAALVELYFLPPLTFTAHFGLIQTPSGFQTSVAIPGNTSVRGNWLLSDGTLFGGTAQDLIVGGFLVVGTPSAPTQASLNVTLYSYFPTYAYYFSSDPYPTYIKPFNASYVNEMVGSFYGYTSIFGQNLPARSFSYYHFNIFDGCGYVGCPPQTFFGGHLMAVHTGGDNYYIVACSNVTVTDDQPPYYVHSPQNCTLSGTGQLAPYTGEAVYLPSSHVGETVLSVYNWFLVLQ